METPIGFKILYKKIYEKKDWKKERKETKNQNKTVNLIIRILYLNYHTNQKRWYWLLIGIQIQIIMFLKKLQYFVLIIKFLQ
jgi:hypothetical protein